MSISRPESWSVRPAEWPDLEVCLQLDPSYSTDVVWQMEAQSHDGGTQVAFRSVRLPRSMRVAYPRDPQQRMQHWHQCQGFLVAERDEEQLIGYVALTRLASQRLGCITDLVIERDYRQQGVGTALVRAAMAWSKRHDLTRLMAELQTKNYPGICFYQQLGFGFCGFNDHYYTNQDITLFFVLGLR
jgi:ribosomal protein S18 acetylase RimI-like enzyme